jgi:uncharacterized protein (TIGR02246 family)
MRFALLAFLAVVPLCASETDTLVKEGAAIRQLIYDQADTWNRGDVAAYVALHSDDFDYTGTDGLLKDRASLAGQTQRPQAQLKSAWRQTRFIRPDVAMVDAAFESTGPDGVRTGVKTFLVEKRDGKWIIVAERTARLPQQGSLAAGSN